VKKFLGKTISGAGRNSTMNEGWALRNVPFGILSERMTRPSSPRASRLGLMELSIFRSSSL